MEYIVVTFLSLALFSYLLYRLYIRLKFKEYEKELVQYLTEAYTIVYIEDIVVYVSSDTIITSDDSEYAGLLRKLINIFKIRVGKKQYDFYKKLLGGEQELIDYINLFFSQKLYDDTVRPVVSRVKAKEMTNKNNTSIVTELGGEVNEIGIGRL